MTGEVAANAASAVEGGPAQMMSLADMKSGSFGMTASTDFLDMPDSDTDDEGSGAAGDPVDKRFHKIESNRKVAKEIERLWKLMVSESCRLRGAPVLPDSTVARAGYVAMHMRVSKALDEHFDASQADHVANADWAEDITAFSGDSTASIWLEEVKKKKFKFHAVRMVTELGYLAMFAKFDNDGSGDLDAEEFIQVARNACNIEQEVVSDPRQIFGEVDEDGGGTVSTPEFVKWLQADLIDISIARELADVDQRRGLSAVKRRFQTHSADAVAEEGWKQLFARYDQDGSGDIDMKEFRLAVRNDCDIQREVVRP